MVAGDQRLIHTPFVPSGYWSPCAPMVCNQGFPTPLGELSVSTNPVKAPDIRFSSSQFRKQHPRHEKAVSYTSLAEAIYSLYTRGYVGAFREGERTPPTLGRTRAFGGF